MNREQCTRTSIQDHGSELRQDRVWLARKQDLYLALTSTAKIQSQLYSGLPQRMALELLAGRRAPKSRSRDLVPELMKQRVLSLVKTKVRHLEENSVSRHEISILVPDSTRQCSPRQSRLSLGGELDLLFAVKRRGQCVYKYLDLLIDLIRKRNYPAPDNYSPDYKVQKNKLASWGFGTSKR